MHLALSHLTKFVFLHMSSRHLLFHYNWIWSCCICDWPAVFFFFFWHSLKYFWSIILTSCNWRLFHCMALFLDVFFLHLTLVLIRGLGQSTECMTFRAVSFAKILYYFLLSAIVCLKIFILFTPHNKLMFFGLSPNPVWNPSYFWSYEDWSFVFFLHLSVLLQYDHLCSAMMTF